MCGMYFQFFENDIVIFNSETIKRKFLSKYDDFFEENNKDKEYKRGYFDYDFGLGKKTYFYLTLKLKVEKIEKYRIAVELTDHEELMKLGKPCNCDMCKIKKKKGISYILALLLYYFLMFISLFKDIPVFCMVNEKGERTVWFNEKLLFENNKILLK